jgi:putative transport protein
MRALPDVSQLQVIKLERGGVNIPIGSNTKLQRIDIVTVVGLKDAVNHVGSFFGRVVRPSTSTDLLTLSFGMILGFLLGAIQIPAFGASVGLGNAGGLLVSGVIVSSIVSRLRFSEIRRMPLGIFSRTSVSSCLLPSSGSTQGIHFFRS